jgi:hypothetical protein
MSVYRIIGRNLWRRNRKARPRGVPWFARETWQAWRQRMADAWRQLHPPPLPGEDAGIPRPDLIGRVTYRRTA